MADTNHSRVYLDHSAATPVDERVISAMEPYWRESYGNAGALHLEGQEAKQAVETARAVCARAFGADPGEIVFTSGGTESNNLAILGLVRLLEDAGEPLTRMHFITSAVEHSSVLDCFRELEKGGAQVTIVPVDREGMCAPKDVRAAIRENTVLVSLMYVNSEIGTIMPLAEIADEIRAARKESGTSTPYFHTDASQAPAYLACKTDTLGVDMMTIDGQKLYGPKGVGCLYIRRGISLGPLMYGGNQERGLRPGTPVTPLIAGLAKAIEIAEDERANDVSRLTPMRDALIERLEREFPGSELNGSREMRLASNVNVSIPDCDGEYLVLALDARGFAISTRSACLFGNEPGSAVVRALGKGVGENNWQAKSAIRISLGRQTTEGDIERLLIALHEVAATAKEPAAVSVS